MSCIVSDKRGDLCFKESCCGPCCNFVIVLMIVSGCYDESENAAIETAQRNTAPVYGITGEIVKKCQGFAETSFDLTEQP